jgi:hypothetical protein
MSRRNRNGHREPRRCIRCQKPLPDDHCEQTGYCRKCLAAILAKAAA